MNKFTFDFYKQIFDYALKENYKIITLKDYFLKYNNKNFSEKILINRIDVDIKIERLKKIYKIFKELKIKASIFLRIHSPYYNLFTIGNIKTIQKLISIKCEIGLHTELEDVGEYCNINKKELLKKEIELLESILGIKIYGTAAHNDITFYNNLDFWKKNRPEDFNLIYEAYDKKLWNSCRYISDSEWINWKSYEKGVLLKNDRRDPIEHIKEGPKIIYLLTHPESWYEEYIWE